MLRSSDGDRKVQMAVAEALEVKRRLGCDV